MKKQVREEVLPTFLTDTKSNAEFPCVPLTHARVFVGL